MYNIKDKNYQITVNYLVFLFFATCLFIPSGYSYAQLSLFIISLVFILDYKTNDTPIAPINKKILYPILLFSSIWILNALRSPYSYGDIGKPIRIILSIPILYLLSTIKINTRFLWFGTCVGASSGGVIAIYQSLYENHERASGFMSPIEFGNISLLLSIILLPSIFTNIKKENWPALLVSLIAFTLGILASFLSGTRGGWITLPLISLFILKIYYSQIRKKHLLLLLILPLSIVLISFSLPQTNVKKRVYQAKSDIYTYLASSNKESSIGLRFEMWKSSLLFFKEKPVFGHGELGYNIATRQRVELGESPKKIINFDHPHNEFLNALVKHGLIGALSLLFVFTGSLSYFLKNIKNKNDEIKDIAIAGCLFLFCIFDFGLSNVFLNRNVGITLFFIPLIIFASIISNRKRDNI